MTAPALLVAARAKWTASSPYAVLASAGVTDVSRATVNTDPTTGLPYQVGAGMVAVTFYFRAHEWSSNPTSARFPKLGVTVWTQGDATENEAEWQARAVADDVLAVFDDPANVNGVTWPGVYVLRCNWDGELSVSAVEDKPGWIRADLGLNLEVG